MFGSRPLRGRGAEAEVLRVALSRATEGRGGAALVLGARGYGKTRLVQEACRTAEENGFLVVPFGSRDFGDLGEFGDLGDEPGLSDRPDLTGRPVLSVLDDTLLGADPGVFSRMRVTLDRCRDRPWFSLITLRSGSYGLDGHRFVSGLEEAGCTRIELRGIDHEAVREVITDILGAPPDAGLMKLADTAAGNPLLVVSLALGLLEDGQVAIRQGLAVRDDTAVPGRLRTTVTCMLNELDQDTQQLVRTAAALGPAYSVDSLVAVFTGSAVRFAASVQQAVDAGVIERRGDELGFRYELVRWAIAETTPPAVRQKVFEEAASALRGGLNRPLRPALPRTPAPSAERSAGPEHVPGADRATDLPQRIHTCLLEGRMNEAHDLAISLLGASRPFGDTAARIQALLALAACARLGGQPSVALRRGREAASLALGMRDRAAFARLAPLAALELALLGEAEIPQWLLQSADDPLLSNTEAREPVADLASGLAHTRLLLRRGEMHLVGQAVEDIVDAINAAGRRDAMALCWAVQALVALRSGQVATAERIVARYKWNEPTGVTLWGPQPEWVALQVATEQQGPVSGTDLLLGRYAHLIATPALFVEEPGAAPWMVRTALEAGATRVARDVANEVRRLADANTEFEAVAASALHAEGLRRRDPELLARAAREHRDPWAAASAAEDLGGLLERADAPDRLAVVLELARAHHGYEKAGDQPGAERTRRCLAGLGPVSAPPPEPRTAVDQRPLSGSERAVTELVVQGMTNRQVAQQLDLSPNTVNFHLRNVYRKFGINSRVELARLYRNSPPTESARW